MTIIKEIKVKSILSKSNLPVSDFSVNPYVGCLHNCKYCYASFMKRFTNHSEEWGTFLDVKEWEEIKNPEKYSGKEFFLSSVTDPYQPLEAKYKRTRKFLQQFSGCNVKISIATKSDLIIRDLDLIKKFPEARVSFSINTLDENFKNQMDNASSIKKRLEAMKIFHDSGIRTTCFISPIFPGITNVEEIIDASKNFCNLIWLENLNLRGDYKAKILKWINENHPELNDLYHEIYTKKNRAYWYKLNEKIRSFTELKSLPYVRNTDSLKQPFNAPPLVVNYFFHEEVVKNKKNPRFQN